MPNYRILYEDTFQELKGVVRRNIDQEKKIKELELRIKTITDTHNAKFSQLKTRYKESY